MVFGSFAENYEFAAMKSSGISLQRAMRSLTFFILFLSVTAFFFANNVIPAAEFKSINLRKNIAQLKPAMAISEGIFNEVGTFNIKVKKKTGDNDQFLEDVIIHEKSNQGGNLKVIKGKSRRTGGKYRF
jgi:lipopolysaccharide export system permease protein